MPETTVQVKNRPPLGVTEANEQSSLNREQKVSQKNTIFSGEFSSATSFHLNNGSERTLLLCWISHPLDRPQKVKQVPLMVNESGSYHKPGFYFSFTMKNILNVKIIPA